MEMELSDPNWFDIVVFSVVGISTLFAFFKGFIRTFLSFMMWVLSAVIATLFYSHLTPHLSESIDAEQLQTAVAFVVLFAVSLVIFMIVNWRLLMILEKYRWGVMDRTLGFGFGLLRGAFLVSLIFFSIDITSSMLSLRSSEQERVGPQWFVQAKTYQLLKITSDFFVDLVPGHFSGLVEKTFESFSGLSGVALSGGNADVEARVMSSEEKDILKRVILALPKEDLQSLYGKYTGDNNQLAHFERMSIYRDIIGRYEEYLASGELVESDEVTAFELERLKYSLGYDRDGNVSSAEADFVDDEFGYKGRNIKQLDRLMNNFSE